MKILGLETSCDETAASLLHVTRNTYYVTRNVVLSQVDIHKKYGGIVPEVAARQHVQTIIPVIEEALKKGYKIQDTSQPRYAEHGRGYKKDTNSKSQITRPDLIAVTHGPGLITSLQVGLQTAKTLSYIWDVPLVGVNHLEAHLWSFILNPKSEALNPKQIQNSDYQNPKHEIKLPAVGLVVSGGHTEMVLVKGIGKYKLLGRTRDDAVGEAFDKVAKLLNIGYPGGPIISHFAKEGDPTKIEFPRPMIDSADFDFSFSGIKTAVKYYIKCLIPKDYLSQKMINDICASFQQAVVEVLVVKTLKAAEKFRAKSIISGGGVSANELLIHNLKSMTDNLGIGFYYPEKEFTQDNAAMTALVGFFTKKTARNDNWEKLTAEPNLLLG